VAGAENEKSSAFAGGALKTTPGRNQDRATGRHLSKVKRRIRVADKGAKRIGLPKSHSHTAKAEFLYEKEMALVQPETEKKKRVTQSRLSGEDLWNAGRKREPGSTQCLRVIFWKQDAAKRRITDSC